MKPERRIDPDYDATADEQLERLTKLAMEAAANAVVRLGGGYSEFPKTIVNKLFGGLISLAITGIVGGVVGYAKLTSLETLLTAYIASQHDQHAEETRRLDNLERHVYRGGPSGPQ